MSELENDQKAAVTSNNPEPDTTAPNTPALDPDASAPDKPKHTRVVTGPVADTEIDVALSLLKAEIKTLPEKQQHIFCEWIKTRAKYFQYEPRFNPARLMRYNRGDIVLVELGYNVGSEYGGKRYAVVIEKNPISRPVIAVVPISTIEQGKTKDSLHESEVFLGEVMPGAKSFAIPLHMRTISKLRIIKPKFPPPLKRLSAEQLDRIDAMIKKYFTK